MIRADAVAQTTIADAAGQTQANVSMFLAGKVKRSPAIEQVLRSMYSDYSDRQLFGEDRSSVR